LRGQVPAKIKRAACEWNSEMPEGSSVWILRSGWWVVKKTSAIIETSLASRLFGKLSPSWFFWSNFQKNPTRIELRIIFQSFGNLKVVPYQLDFVLEIY
jgi:hypothetical protein